MNPGTIYKELPINVRSLKQTFYSSVIMEHTQYLKSVSGYWVIVPPPLLEEGHYTEVKDIYDKETKKYLGVYFETFIQYMDRVHGLTSVLLTCEGSLNSLGLKILKEASMKVEQIAEKIKKLIAISQEYDKNPTEKLKKKKESLETSFKRHLFYQIEAAIKLVEKDNKDIDMFFSLEEYHCWITGDLAGKKLATWKIFYGDGSVLTTISLLCFSYCGD